MAKQTETTKKRPPVVAIMGHVDHGKSTLLDYIRSTNVVAGEAGGITQHISAYEIEHTDQNGNLEKITFLDTPGHAAFTSMRERGAQVADIAILIVSAEDGVKRQTIESLETIKKSKVPYFVAINKIDKPNASPEKVKSELIEHEVYLEGYGGDIPFVEISAKQGTNVEDLLSTILLVAELEELTGDSSKPATGFVVESDVDEKRGISATLVVKDGVLTKGMFVTVGNMLGTTRILEDFTGKSIEEATFSTPIRITGFTSPLKLLGGALVKVPKAGEEFNSFKTKKEAEAFIEEMKETEDTTLSALESDIIGPGAKIIPLIVRTDVLGTTEAILKEVKSLQREEVAFKLVSADCGDISEKDISFAQADPDTVIVGFNVKLDKKALDANEQIKATTKTFNIIYELTEWLEKTLEEKRPRKEVDEIHGEAKVLAFFSRTKHKQVVGGRITEGVFKVGDTVKIIRRENEIQEGKVVGLQQNKLDAKEVKEGNECGILVEAKLDIAGGDVLQAYTKVVK